MRWMKARAALKNYDWPGNVRELENVIRNAVVMNTGEVIGADMLRFSRLHVPMPNSDLRILHAEDDFTFQSADDIRPLAQMENEIIQNAIRVCSGNITEAARRLGINPSTIYRKQKQRG